MRRTSSWDVLHAIRVAGTDSASGAVTPDNVRLEVLSHLDTALHCERYTQRPAYALALSTFKLQLLHDAQDASARFVCMVSIP